MFYLGILSLLAFEGRLDARQIGSITIGQAIGIALQENLDLKMSDNQVHLSEVAVGAAGAQRYPNLTVSASGSGIGLLSRFSR